MTLLTIRELPKLLDATDALAVAVCHYYQNGALKSKKKTWESFLKDNPQKIKVLRK
jgi:crossover junction endodeoxyribonuclease RuvC